MWIRQAHKLLVSLLAIAAVTYLAVAGAVEGETASGLIGVVAGYVLGNGSAAVEMQLEQRRKEGTA